MDHIKLLLFLFVTMAWRDSECYEMAKLYNSRITITSSTLAWVSVSSRDTMPTNAVTVGRGGPQWCRARENAVWVPGAVLEGQCRVPFLSKVRNADVFQVLVSENGSARLETVPWDALVALPPNVVSSPDMLLAVSHGEGGVPRGLPGFVELQERRAYFLQGNETIESREGFLLTEKEPVAYRLTDVRLDENTERITYDEIVEEFVLQNLESNPENVSREIEFLAPHIVSFSGTMKGGFFANLPTNVSGPEIFPVNIRWGITNEMSQKRTHTVSYHLPAYSFVNVTIITTIRVLEGPYSGRLTSVYDDNEERERNIEGTHRERKLAELRANFGQVLSLANSSPMQEWPPHSTILLHSTTTTPSPPSGTAFLPKPEEVGVGGVSGNSFSHSLLVALPLVLLFFAEW